MIKEAKKYKKQLIDFLNRAKLGKKINKTDWVADVSDHINLCNKIIEGKIKSNTQLNSALWNMDTDSRDRVPSYIWKYANSDFE